MKIPHSVVGRTQPTKERDRYLRVQTSPEAFGAGIGRAVAGLGSAVAGLGEVLERRREQTERFAALRALSEFNTEVTARVTEAKRGAEPDGANFPAQVEAVYRNMEDKFLAGRVPPNLQEEFRFRTGQIREGVLADSLRFQYVQQDAFYRAGLTEEFTQAQLGLAKNPEELAHWENWMAEAVDSTDLPAIDKETLKRQYRQGLQAITYREEAYRRASTPEVPVAEPDTGPHPPKAASAISYSTTELRGANAKVTGVLNAVSADLGKKLEIRSGHRTEAQNKAAGGADKSRHRTSEALDISTRGMSQEERGKLIRSAVANGANGIGVYANSVHFDVRAGTGVTRWGPKAKGKYSSATFPEWAGPYIEAGLADRKAGRVGAVSDRSGTGGARTGGSRSWRNNNPGNIEAGDFAKRLGATGSDGRFAIFPDYETGRGAQEHLIFNTAGYKDLDIEGAIARYAPASENDTSSYVNQVAGAVGVPANTKLADLDPQQRATMLDAMQQVEGWDPGNLDDDPRFNLLPYEDRLALQQDAGVRVRKDQAAAQTQANEVYAEDLNSLLVRLNDGEAGQMDVDAWRARTPGARYADINRVQGVLEEKQSGVMLAQAGLAKVEAGGQWNPFDADDKKMLNAIGAQTQANERLSNRDVDYVQRGLLPLATQAQDIATDQAEHLMAMTRSRDIETATFALDTLSQLEKVAMEAYNQRINEDVRSNVEFWRATKGYYTPEERQLAVQESRDPNVRRHRVELLKEGKELAREELDEDTVLREFGSFFGTPELPSRPTPRRALMAEARDVFAEEYVKYGEVDGALAGTLKRLHATWGVTERGGRSGLMKYPPERVYKAHKEGFDWIDPQAWDMLGVEEGTKFELQSDDQTRGEYESGEPPSYTVLYWDADEVPQVFQNDQGQPARIAFEQPVVSMEEQAEQLAYEQALSRYKEMEHQLQLGETDEAVHGTPVPQEFRDEFEAARIALELLGGKREPEPVEPLPVGPRKRTLIEPWIPDNANR